MAVPFSIEKLAPLPFKVTRHVAVTWKDLIIVWGGYSQDIANTSSVVHYHSSGRWIRQETQGNVPRIRDVWDVVGHVIDDKMYILARGLEIELEKVLSVHCLDLNSWTWIDIIPRGTSPPFITWSSQSSWAHNGKIYLFRIGELVCYNSFNNSW